MRYLLYLLLSSLLLPPVMAGTTKAKPDNLELRLQKLENSMSSSGLLDLFQQIENLRIQVNELQGDIEVQNHKLQQLEKRNEKILRDIYARLEQLENNTETQPVDKEAPSDETTTSETEDIIETENPAGDNDNRVSVDENELAAGDEAQAKTVYQAAFTLLKDSRYPEAVEAFSQFLTDYPRSRYSDNAQYWLAESYFVQRDFDNAIAAYQTLLEEYPDSRKLSHGTLKLAYSYQELEQIDEAKRYFEQVVDLFPGSSAAQDASSRLRSLTAEESKQE